MNPSGGSPKTGIKTASRSTKGIIPPINTEMGARASCLSDRVRKSFCARCGLTQCSCGENSSMTVGSKESTAPFLGTNQRTAARNLYARRMRLLISSGLIAGITPTSTRNGSPQKTLDIAFSVRGGVDAVTRKEGC